jgi:CBS domain-containing protein
MYQVKDAMNPNVVSLGPDATIEEAIRLLLKHNISGAPVLDDDGFLCGIITQFQLLEVLYDPDVKSAKVGDHMTRNVFTIEEGSLLGMAANLLIVQRIHRIPVVRGRFVVGILSRGDLLRYFAETGEEIDEFFAKLKRTAGPELLAV